VAAAAGVIVDAKRIVAAGYDRIAARLAAWAEQTRTEERARYTTLLLEALPEGADVLELGCGNGGPTTRALAERFRLTGVDLSAEQIARARQHVPHATFIQADMTALRCAPASFDAVAAFYSIIHVPREEQPALLGQIAGWLRPGGLFAAALSARDNPEDYADDWLGAPMYWSGYDSATNRRLVEEVGLLVERAQMETADEDGVPITFLWIVARKPDGAQSERGAAL
jgi:cyclopropane fatty-acyl-phospholipid synthase-like methyltransferase